MNASLAVNLGLLPRCRGTPSPNRSLGSLIDLGLVQFSYCTVEKAQRFDNVEKSVFEIVQIVQV